MKKKKRTIICIRSFLSVTRYETIKTGEPQISLNGGSGIRNFLSATRDETGEGFIDVLVKMLIVVVVGAVLLAIMRQAIPQIFTDMLTKIRDIFEL